MNICRSLSRKFIIVVYFLIACLLIPVSSSIAYTQAQENNFQRSIVDFRSRLNPNFKKLKRNKTKYIIVHTSEIGLNATSRVVSKGKHLQRGLRTDGGHTHYVIARNGRTYRILDKDYEADHAGLSMWDGNPWE